jgi:hypothetical protein
MSGARMVRGRVLGLCVAWRQSPRYLQQKKGRAEQWCELHDWMRRGSPSHQEVGQRRKMGKMTHQKRCVGKSIGSSW